MTTLRSFQNEIDEIHNREVMKQRTQALLDKEKDKSTKGKTKEESSDALGLKTSFDVSDLNLQEVEGRILVSTMSPEWVPLIDNLVDTTAFLKPS